MDKKKPKFRKPLNPKQINTLKLLYKFRFATTYLIARSQGKNNERVVYSRLAILAAQEYIGRNYDSSYRLRGQHASYYLLPKAIHLLKVHPGINPKVLHNIYKDKTASSLFIDHSLSILAIYGQFREVYPSTFNFYTKSELTAYDHFPKPLPDAYLTNTNTAIGSTDFMLDYYEETISFTVIRRRISQLIEHYESGEWDVTETPYPKVLLVCGNSVLERRLQKHIARTLDSLGITDLMVYTTTLKALEAATDPEDQIWTEVFETEAALSLTNI